MRRFLLATLPMLFLLGCTRHDDDAAKVAALKEEIDALKKELTETKTALKQMQDTQRERILDPERRAADWALANGGDLLVQVDDRTAEVRTAGELPTAHFQILTMKFKSNHKIDDAGLASLKGLSHIRTLDLFDTKIGDAGLAHIAPLTTLEGLTLRDTLVTDRGAVKLAGLTNLKLLDLAGAGVTPAIAKTLQKALPKCQIEMK